MRRYKEEEIIRVKKMREKGRYSFVQLQRMTGIPATTIHSWCTQDIISTRWETLILSNEKRRQAFKRSEDETIQLLPLIDQSLAKILVALIYWCEGSKYPATSKVAFTNSDTQLIYLFTKLFRKAFTIDESKFRVLLQIHTIHDIQKITNFWSKLLDIPIEQFTKPTITFPTGKKHREGYKGTCTLKYNDYRIQLKMIGLYETFVSKIDAVLT